MGGKNKPSISICVCTLVTAVMILVLFFLFFFPAGELEKQQGAKAPSLKTNGAQPELRSSQGSPAGGCSHPLRRKPARTGCSFLKETKIVFLAVCPGNQDERHNAVEVSAQS